jgi:urease accessory protein
MQIVYHSIDVPPAPCALVRICVERRTLAKRRWRGVAEDGREFGFDLEHPLSDGAAVWSGDGAIYVIAQKPEPVIVIPAGASAGEGARRGWLFGNLHVALAVEGDTLIVPDDPAVRQLLAREDIAYVPEVRTFRPLAAAHSHAHEHPTP